MHKRSKLIILKRLIILNPEYSEAYSNRRYTYELQGKYEKAMDDYNKVIELDNNKIAIIN